MFKILYSIYPQDVQSMVTLVVKLFIADSYVKKTITREKRIFMKPYSLNITSQK